MRRVFKVALAAVITLGVTAGSIPFAAASASGDHLFGGCEFTTENEAPLPNAQNAGIIWDSSVTIDGANRPTGATVDCWVDVNGVKADSTDLVATGNGVQANAKQITFAAGDTDIVDLCQSVVYADGSTESTCFGACECDLPPQVFIDTVDLVFGTLNSLLIANVDPVVCPQLVKLAGDYGPLTIGTDGDVTVSDPLGVIAKVYDCPPYDPPF